MNTQQITQWQTRARESADSLLNTPAFRASGEGYRAVAERRHGQVIAEINAITAAKKTIVRSRLTMPQAFTIQWRSNGKAKAYPNWGGSRRHARPRLRSAAELDRLIAEDRKKAREHAAKAARVRRGW